MLRPLAALTVAVAALWAALAGVAWGHSGLAGVAAASAAAGACWLGAAAGLIVTTAARGPAVAYATLAAMGLRIVPPLVLAMFYAVRGGRLWEAGGAWYLLASYGWTLLVESLLAIRLVRRAAARTEAP